MMLTRRFGITGWHVSAVGLGTWNIGNQWGEIDDATAFAGELFAIKERADAVKAIDHIVSQGEGTEAGSSPASASCRAARPTRAGSRA